MFGLIWKLILKRISLYLMNKITSSTKFIDYNSILSTFLFKLDNPHFLASISAYIRVFFEYLRERSDDELPRYSWEATNTLVSNINALRKDKGKLMLMFNEEFTILSSASVMIYFISFWSNNHFTIFFHIYIFTISFKRLTILITTTFI